MSSTEGGNVGRRLKRAKARAHTIQIMLLSNDIIFDKIEVDGELDVCLVFLNTKNISAIENPPLEAIAKQANAELRAVVDSAKDQLCFIFVLD